MLQNYTIKLRKQNKNKKKSDVSRQPISKNKLLKN